MPKFAAIIDFKVKYLLQISLGLVIVTLAGCNNKEGCRDADALNFDGSANRDGKCTYTSVIFYAPGDMIGGVGNKVQKIEIYQGPTPGENLIGTISVMNQGGITGCTPPEGAITYEIPAGGVEYVFRPRYFFDNGDQLDGDSQFLSANSTTECHAVQMTL